MTAFFQSIDRNTETNPTQLALAWADTFRNGKTLSEDINIEIPDGNINNVNILSHQTPLSFLTKRLPLIADTTIISHYGEKRHEFYHGTWTSPTGSTIYRFDDCTCYLRCPDLEELGVWLRDCKPLLTGGDLFYFPDIIVETIFADDFSTRRQKAYWEASRDPLCEIIVENKKLVHLLTDQMVKSKLVRPVVLVDLPYIENVDLGTFAHITADEKEPTERFRDFLRLKFLDLKQNEESEFFETNLAKIGIELRDGVRKLEADFATLKQKRAFQVAGATIAATTAILVAINGTAFGNLPALLGTSGGLLAIANAIQEYSVEKRKTINESPYYYLWLLSQKTK